VKIQSQARKFFVNVGRWAKRILFGKSLRRTLVRAAVLATISFILFKFLLLPTRINGVSMEPRYRNGSINFVNTLRYRFRAPRRGDVVAIRMAGQHVMLLKRIIGLPGERLAFHSGVLIVNGKPTPETYVKDGRDWNLPEVKIGSNEFFVAGDNRSMPIDFYAHGCVERSRIIGGLLF